MISYLAELWTCLRLAHAHGVSTLQRLHLAHSKETRIPRGYPRPRTHCPRHQSRPHTYLPQTRGCNPTQTFLTLLLAHHRGSSWRWCSYLVGSGSDDKSLHYSQSRQSFMHPPQVHIALRLRGSSGLTLRSTVVTRRRRRCVSVVVACWRWWCLRDSPRITFRRSSAGASSTSWRYTSSMLIVLWNNLLDTKTVLIRDWSRQISVNALLECRDLIETT